MLQKIRRQFFSFFMPLLHLQLYRGLCFMASIALRHSPCASGPVTALKLLSLPATHCLMVRYLVLQLYSFRHCSLAFTQSRRAAREGELLSPLKVNTEPGSQKDFFVFTMGNLICRYCPAHKEAISHLTGFNWACCSRCSCQRIHKDAVSVRQTFWQSNICLVRRAPFYIAYITAHIRNSTDECVTYPGRTT